VLVFATVIVLGMELENRRLPAELRKALARPTSLD
jgi:hypothetical protein